VPAIGGSWHPGDREKRGDSAEVSPIETPSIASRWLWLFGLGNTGSGAGDGDWLEADHVADPGREDAKMGVFVGFVYASRERMRAKAAAKKDDDGTDRYTARTLAQPIRAGQDTSSSDIILCPGFVSSQQKRWISVKTKLASFGHKIRQMRRRRRKKEGAGHVRVRPPPPPEQSYGRYLDLAAA
jgi:hypothetical protein